MVKAGDSVRISVIDNGVGIPAENLTRIFQHGFTTRKDGHGFGLHSGAIAAKNLGGTLTAQSDGPGKGATFTLELPLQPASPSTPSEITEPTVSDSAIVTAAADI
jgi:signal transduction histidine kinase